MSNGLTVRGSVENLDANALNALRDAYSKMQQITDSRGWLSWAGVHGYPQFHCWHDGRPGLGDPLPYDLFLPWHRAYLVYWEQAMKDQNSAAALPWWDWTSDGSHQNGIPDSFSVPQANGNDNPLASGPMPAMKQNPARQTQRNPADPANLPSADHVEKLMHLGNFVDFSKQLQDIHDQVHGWVSGDMGSIVTAGFDPIFWSHHCMIDRIWYLWQLQNGANTIPDDYLDKPLAPFALTVRDVLDINRLGYEYAQGLVTVPAQ